MDRLSEAGTTEARARTHLDAGPVYVDGARVTDPTTTAGGHRIDLRIPLRRNAGD
jgi:hypothetical protein